MFLTISQKVIWDLENYFATTNNTLHFSIKIDGPVNCESLVWSLNALVERHEPLRTRYVSLDGKTPQLEIDEVSRVVFDSRDLTKLTPIEATAAAGEIAQNEANWKFDISSEHPLRLVLIKLGEIEHLLLLTAHHIAFDFWSLDIFCREWSRIYKNRDLRDLAPLEYQCVDAAYDQHIWLQSQQAQEQSVWWLKQFEEISLPASFKKIEVERLDVPYLRTARYVTEIKDVEYGELRSTSEELGVSLNALLLAAYSLVLASYFDNDKILIGSIAANRRTPKSSKCLGSFYNNIVYPLKIDEDQSVFSFVQEISIQQQNVLERQELPFASLRSMVEQAYGIGGYSLSQFMFMMDEYPIGSLHLKDTNCNGVYFQNNQKNIYNLNVESRFEINTSISKTLMLMETQSDVIFFIRKNENRATLSVFTKADLLSDRSAFWLIDAFLMILAQFTEDRSINASELILPKALD